MQQLCKNCFHYRPPKGDNGSTCHEEGPKTIFLGQLDAKGNPIIHSYWPATSPEESCGKFKQKLALATVTETQPVVLTPPAATLMAAGADVG